MNKQLENNVLAAVRKLKPGQGLTITPGHDVLTTRPYIKRHSLVSSFSDPAIGASFALDGKRRLKSGSSQGNAFRRRAESSVVRYKDLKPEEKRIVDLMSRMSMEICTMTSHTKVKTKYGVLKMYSVNDELHDTEYVVTTTTENNILFIDRPGDVMVHPIPPFLHKLR